jgi:mono/diheme cytochrome c family protein
MFQSPRRFPKTWFGSTLSLLIVPIAFGWLLLARNSVAAVPKPAPAAQSKPEPKAGEGDASQKALIAQSKKRYEAYKCSDCHGQNGEGTDDAPDLTHSKKTAEEVSKFLVKPSPDAQNKGMPDIPLDNPDHKPLVAYVMSLRAK